LLHSFLTPALDGVEWSTSRLGPLTPYEITPVSVEEEPGPASELVWRFRRKLNPDRPARIRGVTGGTDQTSGGCSLFYTIPI